MQRLGFIGRLKPELVRKYVHLHANVWPVVLENISECNLRNYSIFLKKLPTGEHYVFSYLEYIGEDLTSDMERMAANREVQRWWDECKPCFELIDDLPPGEVWAPMQQLFFQE